MEELKAVYGWLDEHYSEMENSLMELLSIDSVRGEPAEGAPYGKGPDAALQYCLQLAQKQGFATENMDGYVGLVDYPGREVAQMGVLSHVDVVPAPPEGWKSPPFVPIIENGEIYGRGVIDDKGPLIACQYALAAIKESGISLRRSVRHILGTNEETGMGCIDYFVKNSSVLPELGFAPDAVFPVVSGEKGLLRWTCKASWENSPGTGIRLVRFTGGSGINSVPNSASAELEADDRGYALILEAWEKLGKQVKISRDGKRVLMDAEGIAAHAAMPEKGDNAILKILALLERVTLVQQGADRFIKNISSMLSAVFSEQEAARFIKDEYSTYTNLLSLIDVSGDGGEFSCDTRYPVTADGDALMQRMEDKAKEHGMSYSCWLSMPQLFYPKDHVLVTTLMDIYGEEVCSSCDPVLIGSGTYARKLPNFVAFGPLYHDQENLTHQTNERMPQSQLAKLAKIYARAIYMLSNSDV